MTAIVHCGRHVPVAGGVHYYDALKLGRGRLPGRSRDALFELLALLRRETDELESVLRLSRAAASHSPRCWPA